MTQPMNSSSPRHRRALATARISLLTTAIAVSTALIPAAHGQQAPAGNESPAAQRPAPATSPNEAQRVEEAKRQQALQLLEDSKRRVEAYMAAPQVETYLHPSTTPDYRASIFDSEKFRLAVELVNSSHETVWSAFPSMTETDQAILAEAFTFCDDPPKMQGDAWNMIPTMLFGGGAIGSAKSAMVAQRLRNSASYLAGCALDDPDPAKAAWAFKQAADLKKNGQATGPLLEKLDRTLLSKQQNYYAPHEAIPAGDKEANRVLNGYLGAPPVNVGYYYLRSWNDPIEIDLSDKYAVLRRLIATDDPAVFARLRTAYPEMSEPDECMLAYGYSKAAHPATLLPRANPLLELVRFSKSGDAAQEMLRAVDWIVDAALADPDRDKVREAADVAERLYGLPGMKEKVRRSRHTIAADLAANETRREASTEAMARADRATTVSDRAGYLASAFAASYGMPLSFDDEDEPEEAMTAQLLGDLGRFSTLLVANGDPAAMEEMWHSFPRLDWQHQCAFAHAVGAGCRTDPAQTAKVIAALSQVERKPAKLALTLAANGMLSAQLDLPATSGEAIKEATQLKEAGLARPFLLKKLERIQTAAWNGK